MVSISSPSSSTSSMMSCKAFCWTLSPIIWRISPTVSALTTPLLQKPLKHFIRTASKSSIFASFFPSKLLTLHLLSLQANIFLISYQKIRSRVNQEFEALPSSLHSTLSPFFAVFFDFNTICLCLDRRCRLFVGNAVSFSFSIVSTS